MNWKMPSRVPIYSNWSIIHNNISHIFFNISPIYLHLTHLKQYCKLKKLLNCGFKIIIYLYSNMIYFVPTILFTTFTIISITSLLIMYFNNIYIIEWELLSITSRNIKLDLILEWRGITYSSIIILISTNVLKFSKNYIQQDLNKLRFTYIVLLFILSINLLVFIPNIVCLLIGWDGLGITSFLLIIFYINQRSLRAGIFTILTNRLGDTFLLISITITINTGDWSIININNYNWFQCLGILTAAITKRAQIPYSSWLPAVMAAPTPASALVHSSTLVTAGIFIIYRFNQIIHNSTSIQLILITCGILTTLIAGIRAIYENDIKKIIALSTLRQLGLITVCLGLNIPNLAFFHISVHAIFKALLFISAGCLILLNNHNQDLRIYGQFSTYSIITTSSIFISRISLIGIPFIAGFYSKHAIIDWSNNLSINTIIYISIVIAILLTSLYSIRLIKFITITPPRQALHLYSTSKNNDHPLLLISTIRIIRGTAIQWLIPCSLIKTCITNNTQSSLPNYLIIISLLFIIFNSQTLPKSSTKNKFFSSIRFLTPLSTQLLLPISINTSLKLYKHLDQSWLEKTTSSRLSHTTSNLRNTYIFLLTFAQKNLLTTLITRIILTSILLYI